MYFFCGLEFLIFIEMWQNQDPLEKLRKKIYVKKMLDLGYLAEENMSWIERAGDEGDTFEQELPIQGSMYNDLATHWDVFKKIICVFSSSCIQTQ